MLPMPPMPLHRLLPASVPPSHAFDCAGAGGQKAPVPNTGCATPEQLRRIAVTEHDAAEKVARASFAKAQKSVANAEAAMSKAADVEAREKAVKRMTNANKRLERAQAALSKAQTAAHERRFDHGAVPLLQLLIEDVDAASTISGAGHARGAALEVLSRCVSCLALKLNELWDVVTTSQYGSLGMGIHADFSVGVARELSRQHDRLYDDGSQTRTCLP